MITITFTNKDGECNGFTAYGHAGYAEIGKDIVCAAVSALVQGTIAAINNMTICETEVSENIIGGISFQVQVPDITTQTLLAGLEIALNELQEEYGAYLEVCHG